MVKRMIISLSEVVGGYRYHLDGDAVIRQIYFTVNLAAERGYRHHLDGDAVLVMRCIAPKR